MNVVPASYEILYCTPNPLQYIEQAGRTCYKSEEGIGIGSEETFVRMLIKRKHYSVLEHGMMTVRFIVDRGVSHELVRHRICSFSQESTRFCGYAKEKFGREITFIDLRPFLPTELHAAWEYACGSAEDAYLTLSDAGCKPEIARGVLPNSLKTEVVMSANLREWRLIFEQRAATSAHPQMRQVMCPLLRKVRGLIPVLFDDVGDPDCATHAL